MTDQYILDGHKTIPCSDMNKWSEMLNKNRHVAFETIEGITISTIFLGLDHSWGYGPPLLFETLVFDGALDGEMDRYTTWEQAEEGHKLMVERVKESLKEIIDD